MTDDSLITVQIIEKGRYAGRWIWQLNVAPKRSAHRFNKKYLHRNGIAMNESVAWRTARLQLKRFAATVEEMREAA